MVYLRQSASTEMQLQQRKNTLKSCPRISENLVSTLTTVYLDFPVTKNVILCLLSAKNWSINDTSR